MVQLREVMVKEKEVLANLLEYYVYEFSPILKLDVSSEGKYGFNRIDDYFINPNLHPYFIIYDGNIAGFSIVERVLDKEFDFRIDQFFILKRYGSLGLGHDAALKSFDLYRGKWKITQTETNYRAQSFWRKTIKLYTDNKFEEYYDEQRRSVQTFVNMEIEGEKVC
ncbi:putative acetyltransferase [Bacillus mesophilus]|uniref:GNAT family N-acetyltransferase n=1 Tax=Bacillus mesophilus TaxID=1808955 RepID=A0A6M0Q8M8_9BACI|nr:GNAT family N-acetyltransferase [Bacillus mesophilus]MBM7661929.1 putative acetyltransferase [Bacillus mesophilus]NEY72712.1 GNAT family N-acetyltransferase [Bacillus mesophilus]